MITDLEVQHELLKSALQATNNYLAVEEQAVRQGFATAPMLKDFTSNYNIAHKALTSLGVLNKHEAYMKNHLKTIWKYAKEEDTTLADDPFAAMPGGGGGEVDEAVKPLKIKINYPKPTAQEKMYAQHQAIRKAKGLPDPEVYKKQAMQNQKEIESMKESPFVSFTEYLKEGKDDNTLSEEEIDKIVNSLSWDDIVDLYSKDELVEEDDNEDLNEALTAQGRLKKKQAFARSKGKRLTSKNLKLRRASDPNTLQRRARVAARNAIYRKLLKGRDRSTLTASEKSRIEAQVARMKNVMSTIQQKFVPKIRSIEQKRLAHYRGTKK